MRFSVASKFDEENLGAPRCESTKERDIRSTASSVDTLEYYGTQDMIALREQIQTYLHPAVEHKFLTSVLNSIPPISRLPSVLFTMTIEAHKRTPCVNTGTCAALRTLLCCILTPCGGPCTRNARATCTKTMSMPRHLVDRTPCKHVQVFRVRPGSALLSPVRKPNIFSSSPRARGA